MQYWLAVQVAFPHASARGSGGVVVRSGVSEVQAVNKIPKLNKTK